MRREHSRRRLLLGGAALAALGVLPRHEAAAQQAGKVPRIGFLAVGSREGRAFMIEGFRRGLRDHGYVEGLIAPHPVAMVRAADVYPETDADPVALDPAAGAR